MTHETALSKTDRTLTIRVPLAVQKRGGRRVVVTPFGAALTSSRARIDGRMIKILARAFRWRTLIETGTYATIQEIAVAEKINASYVGRVFRLTLLAPDIIDAILDGGRGHAFPRNRLMTKFPIEWVAQRRTLGL
jgi:hypothetical protein